MKESVCAVVVTYNRKDLLRRCLQALFSQIRQADEILVVNNASNDGTKDMLEFEFPNVKVLNLSENIGGSGGFYKGIKWAYEQGYDWIWIMDDDGKPLSNTLVELLKYKNQADVLVPLQIDSLGRIYGTGYWKGRYIEADLDGPFEVYSVEIFTFVGPLIARSVIEKVGLPEKEFFLCADDWNYSLRIRDANLRVLAVKNAIFLHEYGGKTLERNFLGRKSYRPDQPNWKYYYSTRNLVFTIRHLKKGRIQNISWFVLIMLRNILGDFIYEPERFLEKTKFRLAGIRDGLRGRLGRTVFPGGKH
ncbi:glycosyltransferase family 2 protein [Neomoorella humiferrea]|uniref:glycosyltransferase family 2 protein n=1 Tax=Neomoorella humiferrea TaxID=676965 RepID=UPI0030CE5C2C